MKRSIFLTLLASLLIAFAAASAGDEILDKLDDKVKNKIDDDVLDDLEDLIDDCEDDENNQSGFNSCVSDALREFDDREIKSKDKRTILKLAKAFDFEPDTRNNDRPKSGKRRLGQSLV